MPPTLDATSTARVKVAPVTGLTGAELSGVDLAHPLDEATHREIRDAFNAHGVVFFRDQELTPEQYVAFGARFGVLSASRSLPTVPGFPLINSLVREPPRTPEARQNAVGEVWHTDQSFRDEPTFGTMLYCREAPPFGGDTAYINMAAAYDRLSDGLKATLEPLRGVHVHARNRKDRRAQEVAARPEVAVHPVVSVHPDTGRRSLFVSPAYTERFEGWTEEESAPLLHFLYQHAQRPEFGCRFRWAAGSIAFWDNRQVWHYAVNDYVASGDSRRVMHRLVLN